MGPIEVDIVAVASSELEALVFRVLTTKEIPLLGIPGGRISLMQLGILGKRVTLLERPGVKKDNGLVHRNYS